MRAFIITLHGRVQGFGVRPAIVRLAEELQLAGFVVNCNTGVQIHVEGDHLSVEKFLDRLATCLPQEAQIDKLQTIEANPKFLDQFRIDSTIADGPLHARVPPDLATCAECLADVANPDNRRAGYLFTTCTHCGPRYSLLLSMPYDRVATSMECFAPCTRCNAEYRDSADRRFHSQTNSCTKCGPRLWLSDAGHEATHEDRLALERAVSILRAGKILAVKGIGGYQLVVDATSTAAVAELRHRKQRLGKPLAVMVANMAAAEELADLRDVERAALASAVNPIVVASLRSSSMLPPSVMEGLNTVGLMLPTTPLHEVLVRHVGHPLIVTSGNLEGDPLVFEPSEASGELPSVADLMLHHDRPIVRPIDDSVVQIVAGRTSTIRLARGLAPLPLAIEAGRPILALGGHQKSAIALTNGAQAALGPHVGDLESESTRARYLVHVKEFCKLYGVEPALIVHDLHPDYFTTRWAAEQPVPTIAVQHHHAHIATGMLEHNWLDRQVLGVAWDGTGYGTDGTIWGGEFLVTTAAEFQRVASLRPFVLPGGEAAVRQPWRVAVALVHDALGAKAASQLRFPQVATAMVEGVVRSLRHSLFFPKTTSAGRLFDGVAALVLGISESQFEGQSAMLLETACDRSATGAYSIVLSDEEPAMLDWRRLVCDVVSDHQNNVPIGTIAMKFHRALAAAIVEVSRRFAHLPVVLSGGCFNNRVLTELVAEQFECSSQPLGLPGVIPVNDGGLAAGQLAVAVVRLQRGEQPCA